jgi:hypothetical protein
MTEKRKHLRAANRLLRQIAKASADGEDKKVCTLGYLLRLVIEDIASDHGGSGESCIIHSARAQEIQVEFIREDRAEDRPSDPA